MTMIYGDKWVIVVGLMMMSFHISKKQNLSMEKEIKIFMGSMDP